MVVQYKKERKTSVFLLKKILCNFLEKYAEYTVNVNVSLQNRRFWIRRKVMKGCSFTGHRIVSMGDLPHITALLKTSIERAYLSGVSDFYSGGAIGFDTLAAEAVISMRGKYPDVRLIMLLPCRDQDKLWSAQQRERYRKILDLADAVEYVSDEYDATCMMRRNRELVARARLLIAYLKNEKSGTAQTVRLAREGGRAVWNLYEHLPKNL